MLYNIDKTNGILTSTSDNAYAIGTITQNNNENNFSSVKNITSTWKLQNNDTLINTDEVYVDTSINSNDIIMVYYNNILSIVPNDKAEEGIIAINDILTSNDNKVTSLHKMDDAYKVFDNDPDSFFKMDITDNITYKFDNKIILKHYYLKTDGNLENGWFIEGSVDGTNWATISTETKYSVSKTINGDIFNIQTPGNFLYYRLSVSDTKSVKIYDLKLLNNNQRYRIDTKDITKGHKIDKCFINTEQIKINDIQLTKISADVINAEIVENTLKIKILYKDIELDANKYEFKILFFYKNNQFLGLNSDIYKNTNKPI